VQCATHQPDGSVIIQRVRCLPQDELKLAEVLC
jgi:hypothetical protein